MIYLLSTNLSLSITFCGLPLKMSSLSAWATFHSASRLKNAPCRSVSAAVFSSSCSRELRSKPVKFITIPSVPNALIASNCRAVSFLQYSMKRRALIIAGSSSVVSSSLSDSSLLSGSIPSSGVSALAASSASF